MKLFHLMLASAVLLSFTQVGYGLATENIGPVEGLRSTVRQSDWPNGMVEVVGHTSRVYSIWVNGSENFHFKATAEEIEELVKLYSKVHLREHTLVIKPGKDSVSTFNGRKIDYNVGYYFLGGISRFASRGREEAFTYEPTLTIYVDAGEDQQWWNKMTIPANVIVSSEIAGWPVKNTVAKAKRKLWYAKVMFDDTHPAADFEKGVLTKVTFWEKGKETGIYLGTIGHKGQFSVAFSDYEIADLKSGENWLTLTVGNHQTAVTKADTKLGIESMSPDISAAKTVVVSQFKPQ